MSDTTPLIGEPVALDLVNTRPRDADLLDTPARLDEWLALEADRFGEPVPGRCTPADLAAVHDVRAHLTAVLHALLDDRRPPAAALAGLTAAHSAAPAVRELGWHDGAITATPRRAGPSGTRLAAMLAEAAADLLTDPALARLKRCEAEDCVLLFLPAHPRRRWCSPTRCGNRARVSRYYHRHKRD